MWKGGGGSFFVITNAFGAYYYYLIEPLCNFKYLLSILSVRFFSSLSCLLTCIKDASGSDLYLTCTHTRDVINMRVCPQGCVTAWVSWPSATGRATRGSLRTASSAAAARWSSPTAPGRCPHCQLMWPLTFGRCIALKDLKACNKEQYWAKAQGNIFKWVNHLNLLKAMIISEEVLSCICYFASFGFQKKLIKKMWPVTPNIAFSSSVYGSSERPRFILRSPVLEHKRSRVKIRLKRPFRSLDLKGALRGSRLLLTTSGGWRIFLKAA